MFYLVIDTTTIVLFNARHEEFGVIIQNLNSSKEYNVVGKTQCGEVIE